MSSRAFTIRGGRCILYEDRLEIERSDPVGVMYHFLARLGFRRMTVLYGLLFLAFIGAAALSAALENYFLLALFAGGAIVAMVSAVYSWGDSFNMRIRRDQIEGIRYVPPVQGKSRPRFDIFFRAGATRLRRPLPLPTTRESGEMAAQAALALLREENLLAAEDKSSM